MPEDRVKLAMPWHRGAVSTMRRTTTGILFFLGMSASLLLEAPYGMAATEKLVAQQIDNAPPTLSESTGRMLNLPGLAIKYVDTGGGGEAVILLHANTGTIESWEKQIRQLSNRGYRVVAFDRRGWGKSIGSPGSELTVSVAEDLEALVDHLGIKRFHLVGVAGGSYIVLDYAAWKPERVISGVFAASTGEINEPEILEIRNRAALPNFEHWPHFLRELSPSYRASNPEGTKQWRRIESTSRQAGVRFQPTLRTPNTFEKLRQIKTRILVLSADNDFYAPPALMKLIHEQLPNSTWSMINNAGHAVSWEQPEEFDKAVIRFLKEDDQIKSTTEAR